MAANYVLLERIELNASAASVTFASIPQSGYTDLKLVMSVRGASDITDTRIRFNGSSTNASDRWLYGDGSAAASTTNSVIDVLVNRSSYTANTYSNSEIYIPNYLSTTNAKSVSFDTVTENNATAALAVLGAGLWNPATQAAINSITILMGSGDIAANSTFSLYGLAAVGTTPTSAPKAHGGDIIRTDGTYWYHAFLSSSVFLPQVGLTCDYLVVAGGGGGGKDVANGVGGSGGGAGGLRSTLTATGGGGSLESPITVTSGTPYTIIVGAGGTTGANRGTTGTPGASSTFSTVTAIGGGGGASYGINGVNGGSGGGTYNATAGTGTTNQGYAGGNAASNQSSGAGGGGAGSVGIGANATGSVKGNGGSGVTITTLATPTGTGVSGAYAGGGGGGRYGTETAGPGTATAGGGAGGNSTVGSAGTPNTGGGGGGGASTSSNGYDGGAGGSGIVIIRYAV